MSGVGITGKIIPLNGGNFSVYDGQPVASLAALSTIAGFVTGSQVFVLDQNQFYQLDTANTFTLSSPLIVAAQGGGRWFRKSKEYVVRNFTLWSQSYGVGIAGWTPGQLLASGTQDPDIIVTITGLIQTGSNSGIVNDNLGNVWVTDNNAFNAIRALKIDLKNCLNTGTVAASVILNVPISTVGSGPGSSEASSIIFDNRGNLWVGNGTHGTFGQASFARYGERDYQLSGGNPSGRLTVNGSSAVNPSISNQQDSVFDSKGNLWLAAAFTSNIGAGINGGLAMFTPAQQEVGELCIPAIFWTGSNFNGTGLGATAGLAIGPGGFIWVSDTVGNRIQAWDIKTPTSGNPAASIIITCATFNACYGLAFDSSGNLWIQNGADNKLQRIPAASLTTSGLKVADIVINPATAQLFSNLTFANNPDRTGLQPSGAPVLP